MFGRLLLALATLSSACGETQVTGGALPLNMQPAPPTFVGAYDFDLLGQVRGKACLRREFAIGGNRQQFWLSASGLERASRDGFTTQAINAAAFDAINKMKNVDSLVVTRVITQYEANDELCAYVYGRAIRLKKAKVPADAEPTNDQPDEKPKPKHPEDLDAPTE